MNEEGSVNLSVLTIGSVSILLEGRIGELIQDENLYGEPTDLLLQADYGYVVGTFSPYSLQALDVFVKPGSNRYEKVYILSSLGRSYPSEMRYFLGFESSQEVEDIFRTQYLVLDDQVLVMEMTWEMFEKLVVKKSQVSGEQSSYIMEEELGVRTEFFTKAFLSESLLSQPSYEVDDFVNLVLF